MEQIRVATFDGPGAPPVIRTVPRPQVSAKAALFTVGACGVCGTDLHILAGHWPKPLPWPFTLGHEVAGVIDEIGPVRAVIATGGLAWLVKDECKTITAHEPMITLIGLRMVYERNV